MSTLSSWSQALSACLSESDDLTRLNLVLEKQCTLSGASSGALIALPQQGVMALYPVPVKADPAKAAAPTFPLWLTQIAPLLAKEKWDERGVLVIPVHEPNALYGEAAVNVVVAIPLTGQRKAEALGVYFCKREQAESVQGFSEQMAALYQAHSALAYAHHHGTAHLAKAMSVLAAVGEHAAFKPAALAFCNQLANATGARRVALGVASSRHIQVVAISHTDRVERHAQATQQLEALMEECLDQDVEIPFPTSVDMPVISRMAAEHAKKQGVDALVSFPLRRAGEAMAVASFDLSAPLSTQMAHMVRLACDLATPLLIKSHESDRWFGAKWKAEAKRVAGLIVGPRHALAKVAAILIVVALLLLALIKGTDKVDAPFELIASERRVMAAPFEGVLSTVNVGIGEYVEKDKTELASLRTVDLRLKLASTHAEQLQRTKEADLARRDKKTADAQIAQAQADHLAAEARLLESQITEASIKSPLSGIVVEGIEKNRAGNALQRGEKLFEVAQLDSLYAQLRVKESRIGEIAEGQSGELAPTGRPDTRIAFVVEKVEPMAEVSEGENVFRVRVKLAQRPKWILPGMAGVAKVEVGRSLYAWMWTRSGINWVRMKLWW